MATFESLLRSHEIPFTDVVYRSHLGMWRPGTQVVTAGDYLVLGVSPYSLYDLRLLDALDSALAADRHSDVHVAVFDWSDLKQDVLEPDVPHLGEPYHTPLVSLWVDGKLAEVQWGYSGRKVVCDRYQLPIDEISRQPVYPRPA